MRDVQKLLRLPRSRIRALIEAGFVSPARGGPHNAWLFSFQDLIILRTAQALVAAKILPTRITRSMKALRRHLPSTMPLSGLSICAVGNRVVVREDGRCWQADSGQYLLVFEGDPANGSLSVIEHGNERPPTSAEGWFDQGVALEKKDAAAARQAYQRAIAADPALLSAHINLGALLHEAGLLAPAERAYRKAIEVCGSTPVLMYNLGVLLDDLDRKTEAMEAYKAALRGDPALADCHYNLALLCEELKKPKEAIRHMAQYRKLIGTPTE